MSIGKVDPIEDDAASFYAHALSTETDKLVTLFYGAPDEESFNDSQNSEASCAARACCTALLNFLN